MSERPILFRPEMVRAILDGRKTVTRRVVKPQRELLAGRVNRDGSYHFASPGPDDTAVNGVDVRCPYGQPGDRLYVREAWSVCDNCGVVNYRADPGRRCRGCDGEIPERWKPSIHLSRADSRLTLDITEIRVEPVQEISEDGARAEGFTAKHEFRRTWDEIRAADGFGWDANPWVWVVSFTTPRGPQK